MISARRKIEQKIDKKKEEIIEYQSKIREADVSIQAFQEALKVLPKENGIADDSPSIREGSLAGKARKVLRLNGSPMHINNLMDACGVPKNKRQSLSGTLAHYVRREEIFTRPSPGTYGLTEFENNDGKGPPENFGMESEYQ